MEYASIVIEHDRVYHVRQTPLEIIKSSCEAHWSDYDGRRRSVAKLTGYKYKQPIIISEMQSLLAFPTISPSNFDCIWLFFHGIIDIHQQPSGSSVTLHSGLNLTLTISYYMLRIQLDRTQTLAQRLHKEFTLQNHLDHHHNRLNNIPTMTSSPITEFT